METGPMPMETGPVPMETGPMPVETGPMCACMCVCLFQDGGRSGTVHLAVRLAAAADEDVRRLLPPRLCAGARAALSAEDAGRHVEHHQQLHHRRRPAHHPGRHEGPLYLHIGADCDVPR